VEFNGDRCWCWFCDSVRWAQCVGWTAREICHKQYKILIISIMYVLLACISFEISFYILYYHCIYVNPTSSPFFKVGGIYPYPSKCCGGQPFLKSSVICVYLACIDLCHLFMHILFSLFAIHIFPKVLRNNVINYNMSCIHVVCVSNLLLISDFILWLFVL
jgi:hypothetical protein